jgi:hypothetical protein
MIKNFKLFENKHKDIDPFSEEQWEDAEIEIGTNIYLKKDRNYFNRHKNKLYGTVVDIDDKGIVEMVNYVYIENGKTFTKKRITWKVSMKYLKHHIRTMEYTLYANN